MTKLSGEWWIYELDIITGKIVQLMFSDIKSNIPENPNFPGSNEVILGKYHDFHR